MVGASSEEEDDRLSRLRLRLTLRWACLSDGTREAQD